MHVPFVISDKDLLPSFEGRVQKRALNDVNCHLSFVKKRLLPCRAYARVLPRGFTTVSALGRLQGSGP